MIGLDARDPAPLRCGVLGAARITPKALIEPARATQAMVVTRVAARDRDRATAFASAHGIADVSDDYRAVIEADDIDVVYNPLPMALHAEWTIAALEAGKHVLCEKPFASNASEAREMVAASERTGMVLGEAFHYWYHPLFQQVLRLVDSGAIGSVRHLNASFDISIGRPDIRWDYAMSGGSTMDLGCYPIHWVRSVVRSEPLVTKAVAVEDPAAIDAELVAQLSFPGNVTAQVRSSMINTDTPDIRLDIEGTAGTIAVVNPLSPQTGNRLTVTNERGTTSGPVEAGDTYEHMVRAFADHVRVGTPFPTRGEDSVANMAVIDACYTAAGLPLRGDRA